MRDIRIASVQMEHIAGDKRANLEKVRHFTAQASAARAVTLGSAPVLAV